MRVTFFGAAGEVTGSCYLVETDRARVLIDCGVYQGERDDDARNRREFPFSPASLSAVVVTHAHNDHTGRLPLLVKGGYKGPLWATPATCKLAPVILEDAARLQVQDARRETLRNARRGRPPVEPLYTPEDIAPATSLFSPLPLDTPKEIAPGVTLRFSEAGHILGSASVHLTLRDAAGNTKRLVLSGDIGPDGIPLVRDPVPPTGDAPPDLVICESTYGDRDHRPLQDTIEEFAGILREAVWAKEKVLIPAFAIGRTQTLLYYIDELAATGRMPRFPVYLDSPMGAKATALYEEFWHTLDSQAKRNHEACGANLCISSLKVLATGDESRALNDQRGAMVIIAGSGMCNGGRILHHLRHNLFKRDVRIIIAGYQGRGTLGRRLVEGEREVRIFGEPIVVRAQVHTLGGFSAHAGQSELVKWISACAGPARAGTSPRIALTHGEDPQRMTLRERLREDLGLDAALPAWGASYML